MGKKRRTRKQKIKAQKSLRHREIVGFRIKDEDLDFVEKNSEQVETVSRLYKSYLKADLTKTMGLTMLALALELALWQFAFR